MAEAELKNNYLSLYAQNADWKERVLKDDCEIVKYQNDSSVRIWYNEQSESYAPHWHTAMEVIMPVENYYDVITASNSYHIRTGRNSCDSLRRNASAYCTGKRHPLYLFI